MLKIKEQYLDLKVTDPFTGMDQVMRFLDVRLYKYYITYYPDLFEVPTPISVPTKKDIFE